MMNTEHMRQPIYALDAEVMENNVHKFEDMAIGVMKKCSDVSTSLTATEDLKEIIDGVNLLDAGGLTILQFAHKTGSLKFFALPITQVYIYIYIYILYIY